MRRRQILRRFRRRMNTPTASTKTSCESRESRISFTRWQWQKLWRRSVWTPTQLSPALLHDCLEDTDASFDEISHMFGQTVAELVEGVTKLTRVQYSTTEEQQMEKPAQDVHGNVQRHPGHPDQNRGPAA